MAPLQWNGANAKLPYSIIILRLPLEITFSKNIFKKSTQLGVDFLLKNCRIIKIILFYTTSVSLF